MENEYKEFEAKTVDEAVIIAMKSFNADFEDLEIKIVSEGSKGLFGLVGTKTAKIKARHKNSLSEKQPEPVIMPDIDTTIENEPDVSSQNHEPLSQDILVEAKKILSDILERMGMSCEINIREDFLEIMGDGSGLIIGKHGQTLDSLQFLLNRIMNKSRQEHIYITLDTEGYRQRHVDYLKSMALRIGQKVSRTGQSISLERMNPYDRRIIHLTLKNKRELTTRSIGEGSYKKVIIVPRKASRR